MNNLLIAINSKYTHTSLSIRSLKAYAKSHGLLVNTKEYTINQLEDFILNDIFISNPDNIFFSCYIWNIELIKILVTNLKEILPCSKIFLGGPEVSYAPETYLNNLPLDGVLCFEGEKAFINLLNKLNNKEDFKNAPNLAYKKDGKIIKNDLTETIDLNDLPFIYDDLDIVKDRILYYESSRGCPYHCSYCLSGSDSKIRAKSIENTKKDLKVFLDSKVKLVKFVDRTFNFDRKRANEIWQFLIDNDNKITRFHFEIAADLINDENISVLRKARAGLFQFEVGVQTTNPDTLKAINRTNNNDLIFDNVKKIKSLNNIHQHLDLIAGLPEENFSSLQKSFDDIFSLAPEQFQLGFLKVLSGSSIEKDINKYDLKYCKNAPYEILSTSVLSHIDVIEIKKVEDMVERYYNSCRYQNILKYTLEKVDSAFSFFYSLGKYYYDKGYSQRDLTRLNYLNVLKDYLIENKLFDDYSETYFRLDWCLHEKPNVRPEWFKKFTKEKINEYLDFYFNEENIKKYLPSYVNQDPRRISRITHLEEFIINGKNELVLFDYQERDINDNAKVIIIEK